MVNSFMKDEKILEATNVEKAVIMKDNEVLRITITFTMIELKISGHYTERKLEQVVGDIHAKK